MKISDFKKQLAKAGIEFAVYADECRMAGVDPQKMIADNLTFYGVINSSFLWSGTSQGFKFWNRVAHQKRAPKIVSPCGEVLKKYAIIKDGIAWKIGCQTIRPKQRMKLLELLAEDLGYEVEE